MARRRARAPRRAAGACRRGPPRRARSSPSTSTRAGAATGPAASSTPKLRQNEASVTPKSSGSVMRCGTAQTYPRGARKSLETLARRRVPGASWEQRRSTRMREFSLIEAERVTRVDAHVEGGHVRIAQRPLSSRRSVGRSSRRVFARAICASALRERRGLVTEAGIDLGVFAQTTGLPLALDVAEGVAVLGESAAARGSRLRFARGARLHAPRSRGRAPHALEPPRQEGAADRLRLLVRLPRGPAGLAGTVRRARPARVRSDHGRARPLRRRSAPVTSSAPAPDAPEPDRHASTGSPISTR